MHTSRIFFTMGHHSESWHHVHWMLSLTVQSQGLRLALTFPPRLYMSLSRSVRSDLTRPARDAAVSASGRRTNPLAEYDNPNGLA